MRKNKSKKLALIIEIVFILIFMITLFILDSVHVKLNYIVIVIVGVVLFFSFLLTLSLIRYDSLRAIRRDFKNTNLPLYTDQTTLLGHDIKDEEDI